MDKQTIHLITLIIAIIGSNAWSHASLSDRINRVESSLSDRINRVESSLSDRMTALEARVDGIDKRLVIVETSLKANNRYIAKVLGQRLQQPDVPGE
ncbi:MAG: hypothetical protein OXS28_05280 [Gammaproteobacteria bacterium]|nr:hypothetical protein [Gammaproteobacteria bacterium]